MKLRWVLFAGALCCLFVGCSKEPSAVGEREEALVDEAQQPQTAGTAVEVWEVWTELVPCEGVAEDATCMRVKRPGDDEWEMFGERIHGFNPAEIAVYEVEVAVSGVEGSADGTAAERYDLVGIIGDSSVEEMALPEEHMMSSWGRSAGDPCVTNADCGEDHHCDISGPGCGVTGVCREGVRPCTTDLVAFCACRGITVEGSSSCPPETYAHEGPCDDDELAAECTTNADCGAGEVCTGPAGCNVPFTCQPAERCSEDVRPYCTCDGATVMGSTTCPPVQFAHRRPCDPEDVMEFGGTECVSNSDCPSGTMCSGPMGCGIPWTCQPQRPCTRDLVPFCSCDGTTVSGSSSCPPEPYRSTGRCP